MDDRVKAACWSAPVRLDFAGGWTDVAPYATERRGMVVNAAIERRVVVEVEPADRYRLRSEELDLTVHPRVPADFEKDGKLDLLKAAVRSAGIGPCAVRVRSDVPPGSGLGSSGALGVALVAALDAAAGREQDPSSLVDRAWHLEAVEADLPGGTQDQYAAARGGFTELRYEPDRVLARSLRLDPAFRSELESRILICHTGQSRVSSDTIARVMGGFVRGDSTITAALDGLAEVAAGMVVALEAGDLRAVGALLLENWGHQQRLDPGMRTGAMAALERALEPVRPLGWKAAGAGAGGSMFFLLDGRRDEAEAAATAAGATVLPFRFTDKGAGPC
ncbi:MAG: hypothetical protein R2909_21760 [Gemmatimonadales bacterium]